MLTLVDLVDSTLLSLTTSVDRSLVHAQKKGQVLHPSLAISTIALFFLRNNKSCDAGKEGNDMREIFFLGNILRANDKLIRWKLVPTRSSYLVPTRSSKLDFLFQACLLGKELF